MKPGTVVATDPCPSRHSAQLRRAVPAVAEVVLFDPPYVEVRPLGPCNAATETFILHASEVRPLPMVALGRAAPDLGAGSDRGSAGALPVLTTASY